MRPVCVVRAARNARNARNLVHKSQRAHHGTAKVYQPRLNQSLCSLRAALNVSFSLAGPVRNEEGLEKDKALKIWNFGSWYETLETARKELGFLVDLS